MCYILHRTLSFVDRYTAIYVSTNLSLARVCACLLFTFVSKLGLVRFTVRSDHTMCVIYSYPRGIAPFLVLFLAMLSTVCSVFV